MRRRLAALLLIVACAPVPERGERQLSAAGIRPGVGAAHDFAAATPPLGTPVTYLVRTPLREQPNRMEAVLSRAGDGYVRTETVRIPESSAAEAQLIATMVRQREGRSAEVEGTEVVLRSTDRLDPLGRTVSTDNGGPKVGWDPHNCHGVIGECRTARTGSDGRREHLVVTTAETGGVWHEQVRLDPARHPQGRTTLLQESFYSLDPNGVLIDMNRLDHERDLGGYRELRRVQ